jgi:Thioredoxin
MALKNRYDTAPTFEGFLASAVQNKELWATMYRLARVPQSLLDRLRALPRRSHLLVLSEDWCGDAVNTIPAVARLAALSPETLDLRILARDQNADLMDAHLTGSSRSIPVVIVLDEDYVERSWWGPRPRELQAWVTGPGKALDKAERYREIRRWYARDRAVTTLEELVALIETANSDQLSALSSTEGGRAGRR